MEINHMDSLNGVDFFHKAWPFGNWCWNNREKQMADLRKKEIARQLTCCADSFPPNLKQGYAREFSMESPRYLRLAKGSVCFRKDGFKKGVRLISEETNPQWVILPEAIITGLNKRMKTFETRNRKK